MTVVGSDDRLPAHRIALRATLGATAAGLVGGPVTYGPSLINQGSFEAWFGSGIWKNLLVYASLFLAIRAFLLVVGEELVRDRGVRSRIVLPVALLFVLGMPLETWAMVWAGHQLSLMPSIAPPLDVLPDVLERLTYSRLWGLYLVALLPFWILLVARIWWGAVYSAAAALGGGVVAVMLLVTIKGQPGYVLYAASHLFPAMATGLALGVALAAERRLMRAVKERR